jgi:hypothetical protein
MYRNSKLTACQVPKARAKATTACGGLKPISVSFTFTGSGFFGAQKIGATSTLLLNAIGRFK